MQDRVLGDTRVSTSIEFARLLRDFVDTLIPGDDRWPSAADVGVHGVLGMRMLDTYGESGVFAIRDALAAAGAPFPGEADGREAIVARFEAADPGRFKTIRMAAYLAYYEHPAVIQAIQGLGQPYRAQPVYEGYRSAPFDRARDTPRHGRGHYVATNEVRRVDLTNLPHLRGPQPSHASSDMPSTREPGSP